MTRERRQERRAARQERRREVVEGVRARRAERAEGRGQRTDEPQRRRRSPEVARQELLDAAERVFREVPPDQVGLKEIAREAGTSHALITHYFGTYGGLVEATLERRLGALRETMVTRLTQAGVLTRPEEMFAILFEAFEDPVHLRLMKWLISSERPGAQHALALQHHALQVIAQQIALAITPHPAREMLDTIELTLLTAVATTLGFAVGKHALAGAAGRAADRALVDGVRTTLAGMVRSYLTDQLGPVPTTPST
jgi:AcrR family transcriptional regulator